ncbi:IS66 family transposase [Maribrevibacterium harenarium]|uniref:IS66 family transposase n=1 Tax=Maribrevibacterium harenarium TaxID=2589817 RepID=A0A501WI18_9GAMM|nr:IS66 family transposase [Maribrevibacterium harenarium]TPE49008.1 IS66 family transposase [Maribrevibacterium harenarium]
MRALIRVGSVLPSSSTPMPAQVFEGSLADVSFIAGLLVDKFQYHLPLHRQHQRLTDAGITMARSTLTNLVKRGIELLRPIHDAQLAGVLHSHVLAMDETPLKACREPKGGGRPGKMQSGWIWPIYGDQDEIVFTYSKSRSAQHIRDVLANNFSGVLLSDGYSAYASYVAATESIEQAQCWAHTRRGIERAEKQHPQLAGQVLDTIAALYRVERQLESLGLTNEAKRGYRQQNAEPIVSRLMTWAREQLRNNLELTPGEPITKALKYMVKRETQLSVFLKNPAVSLDTNHLERGLRPIPMGRKNWMFCWTEIGAEHVGIIQSLIATCKIHGVNPTHYLIDVLQRVSIHPSRQVAELTPRRWKELFADERMISFVSGKGMQHAH